MMATSSPPPPGTCTAIVWNLATGDRQEQLAWSRHSVVDLGFSPDDDTLYTGSLDQQLLAWDLDGDRHLLPRGHRRARHQQYPRSIRGTTSRTAHPPVTPWPT